MVGILHESWTTLLLNIMLIGFLTYLRETWFLFSYGEVVGLIQLIEASDEIDRVSKIDKSFSFGVKQNAL